MDDHSTATEIPCEMPYIRSRRSIIGAKIIISPPDMLAYNSPIGPKRKVRSNAIPRLLGDLVTKNCVVIISNIVCKLAVVQKITANPATL